MNSRLFKLFTDGKEFDDIFICGDYSMQYAWEKLYAIIRYKYGDINDFTIKYIDDGEVDKLKKYHVYVFNADEELVLDGYVNANDKEDAVEEMIYYMYMLDKYDKEYTYDVKEETNKNVDISMNLC